MSDKIKCYCKRPDSKLYSTWISNNLKNLQTFVGGYIEVVPVTRNIVMICNEEGKLQGLDPNFRYLTDMIVGPVIFCGVKGEEFADMPVEFEEFKRHFEQIFKEVRHG